MASSMGGGDEGTIGGMMFDMFPSSCSVSHEAPYSTATFLMN
jgi:hypothetical protein